MKYVSARIHACVSDVTSTRTIAAYRLQMDFDPMSATWIARSAAATWTQAGADAVPADREASPFATLTFQPAGSYWSEADSGDIASVVQAWHDDATSNHGFVLVGAPGDVDVNNGNCPLRVTGFLGRPLAPAP